MGGLSIRVVDKADLQNFSVGSEHKGTLKVEGIRTECRFRVVYLRGALIGGEWIAPDTHFTQQLTDLLSPRRLGQALKNYPVPDLPNLQWFHTPVGVDLLVYRGEKSELNRWVLYFHQTFLQWEADSGIKTGQSLAEDEEGYAHGIVRLETRLLEFDDKVDCTLLVSARDFVDHATSVEESIRTLMKHQIEGAIPA